MNGVLIGVLYIHNTGRVGGRNDLYTYEAVYHQVGDMGVPRAGIFKHSRADGAEVCVGKALKSLHGN